MFSFISLFFDFFPSQLMLFAGASISAEEDGVHGWLAMNTSVIM
jgi:hypothetical protein